MAKKWPLLTFIYPGFDCGSSGDFDWFGGETEGCPIYPLEPGTRSNPQTNPPTKGLPESLPECKLLASLKSRNSSKH